MTLRQKGKGLRPRISPPADEEKWFNHLGCAEARSKIKLNRKEVVR